MLTVNSDKLDIFTVANSSNHTMRLVLPPSPTGAYDDIRRLFSVYYDAAVNELFKLGPETWENIYTSILAYIFICVAVYWLSAYTKLCPSSSSIGVGRRVLFVTAHPDDECMFFGPLIVKMLKQRNCEVYLLCLSKGNHENKGNQRKQELWKSCHILGIPESNITLIVNAHFPDNPDKHWREDMLSALILKEIETLSINTVITFDKYGVSRHKNHCSLYYAVAFLCLQGKLPSYCRAFALESTSLLRKYSFILDVPLSYLTSPLWYIVSIKEHQVIKRAMQAHTSQLVWFRKLYLIFSRYVFINTLREIEILDLELDIDLRED